MSRREEETGGGLPLRRMLYLVLVVALLGGAYLAFALAGSQQTHGSSPDGAAPAREFVENRRVDEGQRPRVWILGDPDDARDGAVACNVGQLCEGLHLTIAGMGRLDADAVQERDLVVLCDADVARHADPAALEKLVYAGGRVVFAAGPPEGEGADGLRAACGIRSGSARKDCRELVFEGPLLPVQPDRARYEGASDSVLISVDDDATVYLRDAEDDVPLLYTRAAGAGGVCVINGAFLEDARYLGLLTGAIGALLPDFVYPVLGVKTVFLDNFPAVTAADDERYRRAYGYTARGFVLDEVWAALQGISLRTDTPYTASVLVMAPAGEELGPMDGELLSSVGKAVLRFGGELGFAARCADDGRAVVDDGLVASFAAAFPGYVVQSLALESGGLPREALDVPDADIRFVRGMLEGDGARLSWDDAFVVFPAATEGSSLEDGGLLALCSVLGAYGMVSHVLDADDLIAQGADGAAWDRDKRQLGLLESEVLAPAAWLEGRTLSQVGEDVRSYQDLDYGWRARDGRLELDCGGIVRGQAFLYHADGRIVDAEGLTYQDVGNGYYLLRVQESHAAVTLEGGR